MCDLFKELEAFGFKDLGSVELFESKDENRRLSEFIAEQAKIGEDGNTEGGKLTLEKVKVQEEYIFKKLITCKVCDHKFEERVVKKGKLRLKSNSIDLKPTFEHIEPLLYDVILCPNCGYTAITRNFEAIFGARSEWIKQRITPSFINKDYPLVMSADEGIERYKLALYNAIMRKSGSGERAFICMKIAWIYRDKGDKKNEMIFLKAACEGFIYAFKNEDMPICGIDENTLTYLIACFYKQMGELKEAFKWISPLVVSRTIEEHTRKKALDLRDDIKAELDEIERKSKASEENASDGAGGKQKTSLKERLFGKSNK